MTTTAEEQKKEMEKKELEAIKKREKEDEEKKKAAAEEKYEPIKILEDKFKKAEKTITDLKKNEKLINEKAKGTEQEKKCTTAEARIKDAYGFMSNANKFNAAYLLEARDGVPSEEVKAERDNDLPTNLRRKRMAYIKNMVASERPEDEAPFVLDDRINNRDKGTNNNSHKLSTDLTADTNNEDLTLQRLKDNPPHPAALPADHDRNVLGNIFTYIPLQRREDHYKNLFDGRDRDGTVEGYDNYNINYLDGGDDGRFLYTLVDPVGAGDLTEDKKTELEKCIKDVSTRFLEFLKAYNFRFNGIGWAGDGGGLQYKGNYTIEELKDALKKKLGKKFSVRDIEDIIFDINVVQRHKPCDGAASNAVTAARFAGDQEDLVSPKYTLDTANGTDLYADNRLILYQHSSERRNLWYEIDPTSDLAKNYALSDPELLDTALRLAQSCRRYGPSETPISTLEMDVKRAEKASERRIAQSDLDERQRLLDQFNKEIDNALEEYPARKYKFPITLEGNDSHLVGDDYFMKAFYQDKKIQGLVVDFLKKCDGGEDSKKMTIRNLGDSETNGVALQKSEYVEFVEMGSVTNNVILRYIFEKSVKGAYAKIRLEDDTKKVDEEQKRYKKASEEISGVTLKRRGSVYDYSGVKLLKKKFNNEDLIKCIFYYARNVAEVTGGYLSMGASYSEETLINFASKTDALNTMFNDIELPQGFRNLIYSAVEEAKQNKAKEDKKKEDEEKASAEARAAKAKADAARAPAPAPAPGPSPARAPAPSPAPGPSPAGDKGDKEDKGETDKKKEEMDKEEKEVEEKLKKEIDKTPQKKDSKEKKLEYIKQLDELRKQKDLEIDAKHKDLSGKIDLLEASKTRNEQEIEKLNREKEITLETINISLQELRSYKEGYNAVTEKKRNILIDYVDRLKKKQLIQDQNYSTKVLENEKHKRLLTQIKNERVMLLKLKQDYEKQKGILEQKEREIMEEKLVKEKEKEQRERIQSLKENRLKKQLDELKRIQHIKERKLKKEIHDLKEKQTKLQGQFHTSSTEELSSNPEDKGYLLQKEVLKGKEKQLRGHLKKSLKKGKAPITYVPEDKPSKKSRKFTRKKPKRKKKESFIESITPDFMKVKV